MKSELGFKSDVSLIPTDSDSKIIPKQIKSNIKPIDGFSKSEEDILDMSLKDSQSESIHSSPVNLNLNVHYPTHDKWNNLEKILNSQILKIDQLD